MLVITGNVFTGHSLLDCLSLLDWLNVFPGVHDCHQLQKASKGNVSIAWTGQHVRKERSHFFLYFERIQCLFSYGMLLYLLSVNFWTETDLNLCLFCPIFTINHTHWLCVSFSNIFRMKGVNTYAEHLIIDCDLIDLFKWFCFYGGFWPVCVCFLKWPVGKILWWSAEKEHERNDRKRSGWKTEWNHSLIQLHKWQRCISKGVFLRCHVNVEWISLTWG